MKLKKLKPKMQTKKGSIMLDMFIWVIIGFVAVLFFAGFMYGFGIVTNTMTSINDVIAPDNTTIGEVAQNTFGQVNSGYQLLKFVALCIFIGMCLNLFITSFFSRIHPVFFVLYLIIWIVVLVVSILMTITYNTMRVDDVLGATIQSFGPMDFILQYLPYIVAVLGGINAVLLFTNIEKEGGGY